MTQRGNKYGHGTRRLKVGFATREIYDAQFTKQMKVKGYAKPFVSERASVSNNLCHVCGEFGANHESNVCWHKECREVAFAQPV